MIKNKKILIFVIAILSIFCFSTFFIKNTFATNNKPGAGYFYWAGTANNEIGPFNMKGYLKDPTDLSLCSTNLYKEKTTPKSSSCYWGDKIAVSGVNPTQGVAGDVVTITGLGFNKKITDISFNGTKATEYKIVSDKELSVTVPTNFQQGYINITSSTRGTASGAYFFDKNKSVEVSSNNNNGAYKSTYTLLAPIGNLKSIKTDSIGDYFNVMVKIIIGLCAALAVIMLIISGIQYMGEESIFGKTEAKKGIWGAIAGLVIALGSYALLNTINPDLLGGKGLSIEPAELTISAEDTSTGSSTSLCISKTNPPNPDSATGTSVSLNSSILNEYIPARDQLANISTGTKLLITAQTHFEGFYPGSKSYRTKNPGNIGNTDDGKTKQYGGLSDGIQKQADIIKNIVGGKSESYKTGGKYTCALGEEVYNGYLYQYLRIYATGARENNNYLNAIIGYFRANGKTITPRTTISEIYNMQ